MRNLTYASPLSIGVVPELQDLCETCGPAEALNARIFESLQSTITASPGNYAGACSAAKPWKAGAAQAVGTSIPVSALRSWCMPHLW